MIGDTDVPPSPAAEAKSSVYPHLAPLSRVPRRFALRSPHLTLLSCAPPASPPAGPACRCRLPVPPCQAPQGSETSTAAGAIIIPVFQRLFRSNIAHFPPPWECPPPFPPPQLLQEYFTDQYVDLDAAGGTGVATESPPS